MGSNQTRNLDMFRDVNQMREIFQRYLLPADNPVYVVESCAVDFVRQASSRCLLQYTLQLRETDSGQLRSQVVTGVTYDEIRGPRILARLRRSSLNTITPTDPALPAVVFVPELHMLIQVFPFDHRLPALARLLQGPPPELATVLEAELGPGDWRLEAWEAEPLRYRVDMRAMVRLGIQAREAENGRTAHKRFYAKIYRETEEGERAHEMQRALWQRTTVDDAGFVVARPIAYLDEQRTLLLDEVAGNRFLDVLRKGDEKLPATRCVARAIAALHQVPLDDAFASRERPPRDELARFEAASETLRAAVPDLAQAIDDIGNDITRNFANGASALTHFDLKPGHILVDGDRVALLDFDKLVVADPMVDVAGLLTHLGKERRQSQRRQRPSDVIARAFAEEYFTHVPDAWYHRLPAFYAMSLLVDAATTHRGLRGRAEKAGRANRVAAVIREAQDAVAGMLW
jgi:aminoglycoside phosphotransferase (APT) family kinase protein